jgi:hypothetical protein
VIFEERTCHVILQKRRRHGGGADVLSFCRRNALDELTLSVCVLYLLSGGCVRCATICVTKTRSQRCCRGVLFPMAAPSIKYNPAVVPYGALAAALARGLTLTHEEDSKLARDAPPTLTLPSGCVFTPSPRTPPRIYRTAAGTQPNCLMGSRSKPSTQRSHDVRLPRFLRSFVCRAVTRSSAQLLQCATQHAPARATWVVTRAMRQPPGGCDRTCSPCVFSDGSSV